MESLGSCSGLADVIDHNYLTVLKLTCLTFYTKRRPCNCITDWVAAEHGHHLRFCMVCDGGDNDDDYNEARVEGCTPVEFMYLRNALLTFVFLCCR
jgi:hypothetical protein